MLERGLRIFAREAEGDAEIIALSEEILRIDASTEEFSAKHIEPLQERYDRILHDGPGGLTAESAAAAGAFSQEVGREDAIRKVSALDAQNERLFERMMSIPATTQPARAAKVRALMVYVLDGEWYGPGRDLDWEKEETRKLLGEFAGMTEDELAKI